MTVSQRLSAVTWGFDRPTLGGIRNVLSCNTLAGEAYSHPFLAPIQRQFIPIKQSIYNSIDRPLYLRCLFPYLLLFYLSKYRPNIAQFRQYPESGEQFNLSWLIW